MSTDNEIVQLQVSALRTKIDERNGWVEKVNAATGDRDSLVESIRDSAQFESLRNQIAELEEQLDAQVEAKVEETLAEQQSDEGEINELKKQVAEVDKTVKGGIKFLREMYPEMSELIDDLPKLNRVRGVRRAGGKRIKGYNLVVTDSDGTTEFGNFSGAAKYLGLDTKDLQEAFYAKAGVEKLKDAPDVVKFTMTWTDVDENENEEEVSVDCEAYRTAKQDDSDSEDSE